MWPRPRQPRPAEDDPPAVDVRRVREHFAFARTGRVVTNNAATTQPPRELVDLYRRLVPCYENVHRGQSAASQRTTRLFEEAYDTIAAWVNAPSRRSIATYRNTTEAINAVMYTLLTELRDGDNVVTTMMEHNSNFVPWYAMCREILPQFGRRVECRVARFDHVTGRLDLDHLAELVDERTKLVAVTGASNFLGTKPPLAAVRRITRAERLPAAGRRVRLAPARRRRPARADDRGRRPGPRRRLPGLLLPQDARALRGRRPRRQGAAARGGASLPLRRRHGRGGAGGAGPRRLQRPALEVRGGDAEHPRRDRLGAGAAAGPRPRPRRRAAVVRHLPSVAAHARSGPPCTRWAPTPGS